MIGWLLDRSERADLLERFPPAYPDVIADHVTLTAEVSDDAPLPCESSGEIVGTSDDGRGVQALAVRIGDTTDRPDGSTYHVVWSLNGTKAEKPSKARRPQPYSGGGAFPRPCRSG